MKHNYTCTNGDIELCPLSEHDSEQYRQLRNLENNRKWFLFSGMITKEAQKTWYDNYLKRENDYMFSIYNQTGQFLGGAALYDITRDSAEFGRILVNRAAAGKSGTGYQALMLLCQLAKKELSLRMLHLEVFEDNLPARKLYEKAGFVYKKQYASSDSEKILHYMEKML